MKKNRIQMAAAAAVLLLAISGCGKNSAAVEVEGIEYPADAAVLDLRGSGISLEHYETLCGKLPECQVLWDVPFQGKSLSSEISELTVTSLTEEDAEMLAYFPKLRQMDATACENYDIIMQLLEKRPRCCIDYQVRIGDQSFPRDTKEIRLASGESSGEELLERLGYLRELEEVFLEEPQIPARQLDQLIAAYPRIHFEWVKTAFGKQHSSEETFLDISGMRFSSLVQVEKQAAYFPHLKQLDMLNSGFSNEMMAMFRDRVRDRYKVVFNVQVGTMDLRTDILTFFPDRDHGKVRPWMTYNLRYCEDLVCVDVGHLGFWYLDWVSGTPHLKYLIMSDGAVQDLTPLSQLKELEFLEVFMCGVVDTTPLAKIKSLRDLNLARCPLGDVTPLTQMPWLEKLWVTHCPMPPGRRELLENSLPNTHIEFEEYYSTWGGWRDMPRYFDMRDVLGVPYMR